MHKTITRLTLIALAMVATHAAHADGPFIDISLGNASLDDDFDGLNIDESTTALRLIVGWRFNDYFALEAGYRDFGDFEESLDIDGLPAEVSLSADGFVLGARGTLPLGERFALQARLGSFFWNGSAQINAVSVATPEDSNLFLGTGLRVGITEKFFVAGDWTRYELEDTESDVFSLGVQYLW